MKYRLFLSDFDGTLVRPDGTISDKNKQAIARYREAGGVFAVVTGRMLTSILPRLRELGLEDGLVCAYQGATVADIRTGELLKNGTFEEADALAAIRYLEKEGHHVHVYTVDTFYCNMDDEPLHLYEKICAVKGEIEPHLSDMVAAKHLKIVKLLAMVPSEQRHEVCRKAQETLGDKYFVTVSSEYLVEIMPAGQNKASAVDFLSEYYHVPHAEIAAVGDQLNDLPMLERAGGRFAVSNAEEELKKVATVLPSGEEDGVAEALYKYALGR